MPERPCKGSCYSSSRRRPSVIILYTSLGFRLTCDVSGPKRSAGSAGCGGTPRNDLVGGAFGAVINSISSADAECREPSPVCLRAVAVRGGGERTGQDQAGTRVVPKPW